MSDEPQAPQPPEGEHAHVVGSMMRDAAQAVPEGTPMVEAHGFNDVLLLVLLSHQVSNPKAAGPRAQALIEKAKVACEKRSAQLLKILRHDMAPAPAAVLLLQLAGAIAATTGFHAASFARLAEHILAEPGSPKRLPLRQLLELGSLLDPKARR